MTENNLGKKDVTLVGRPHPLHHETIQCSIPEGSTISEMLAGLDTTYLGVRVGGHSVPQEAWRFTRPKAGTTMEVVMLPKGGGSDSNQKAVLTVVAMVAITALSMGAGTWVSTMMGSTLLGNMATVAVGVGGMLLMRALIKPPKEQKTRPSYSLTGQQNQMAPYGTIPLVIGDVVFFPPLAAKPYTERAGEDQYFNVVYDLGYGQVSAPEEMKFGRNPITDFDLAVDPEIGANPWRWSHDVDEEALSVDLTLNNANHTTSTASQTDEVSMDFSFPAGLYRQVDGIGDIRQLHAAFRIEYWDSVAGVWHDVGVNRAAVGLKLDGYGRVTPEKYVMFSNTSSDHRKAFTAGVRFRPVRPEGHNGQYQLRVTKIGTFLGTGYTTRQEDGEGNVISYGGWELGSLVQNSDSMTNNLRQCFLTVVRSFNQATPASTTGTTKIGLKVRATQQLNGALEQFSCRVKQLIPAWNGTTWLSPGVSTNPACIFRWLFVDCEENARQVPESKLDMETIQAWAEECDAKGFSFSAVVDNATSFKTLIDSVCAAGRASFAVIDGKYSVIRDNPQAVPVQYFTPRNMKNFQGSRAFSDTVHALKVRFRNRTTEGWQQDEIVVYDDDENGVQYTAANATKFETMEFVGVNDPVAAWKLGRYHMAVARRRQSEYTWGTDVEHLVCRRGDLVKVAHDVVRWGSGFGRVRALAPTSLTLDDPLTESDLAVGTTYTVRVREQTGASETFTGTYLGNGSFSGTIPGGANVGDLVMVGEPGQEAKDLLITRISPGADLSATITAVDYEPAVYDADDVADMPAFVSQITGAPYEEPPPIPRIRVIYTTAQGVSDADAGYTTPIVGVDVSVPPATLPPPTVSLPNVQMPW